MTPVTRHESRERALAILYEAAQKHLDPRVALAEATVAPDPYSELLVGLASEHGDEARRVIEATAANWPIERIGLIDRLGGAARGASRRPAGRRQQGRHQG